MMRRLGYPLVSEPVRDQQTNLFDDIHSVFFLYFSYYFPNLFYGTYRMPSVRPYEYSGTYRYIYIMRNRTGSPEPYWYRYCTVVDLLHYRTVRYLHEYCTIHRLMMAG